MQILSRPPQVRSKHSDLTVYTAHSCTCKTRNNTFIEIQSAHGVPNDGLELSQLSAALQQLICQLEIQLRAPHHRLTQDHLLETGQEHGIHRLPGDHHRAWLQTWEHTKEAAFIITHPNFKRIH